MFGSLLGAVRDGDLIEGSGDIDVGFLSGDEPTDISADRVVSYFSNRPCYFNYPGNPIINCQVFHKIGDLYYFIQANGLVQGGFRIDGFERTLFGDNFWYIPSNYEELLEIWYGKDWKIPKKGIHATLFNYNLILKSKENENN